METEQMSSLIETFFNDDFQTIKLEDTAVDYTLRCNKGSIMGTHKTSFINKAILYT